MINILRQERFVVFGLILVGILLNVFLVPFTTFWIDESMAVNFTYKSNTQMVSDLMTTGAHPPLYYFIVKTIRIIFGDTESNLRFISSIFFILTSFFIYLLAKRMGGKSTGFIALTLWASNFFLLFYSKQVRPYSLLAFLSVASMYFFYELQEKFRRRDAILYFLFTVAGLYTGYWFVLLFFAQTALFFFDKNRNWKQFWILFTTGLLFLPWALTYIFTFKNYGIGEFIVRPGLSTIWESLSYLGNGQWLAIIPAILVGFLGAVSKNNLERKKNSFLLFYFAVPLIAAFIISQFVPIYTPGRREIIVVPAFIIALSYLISRVDNKQWQVGISIFMIIFAFQNIFDRNTQINSWKSSDLSVIQDVQNRAGDGDYFILYGLTNANFNYYTRRLGVYSDANKIYFPEGMEKNQDSLLSVNATGKDSDKLNQSLDVLKKKLSSIKSAKFFVFLSLSDDELLPKLVEFLDNNLERTEEIIPEEPRMASWIDLVLVYEKK